MNADAEKKIEELIALCMQGEPYVEPLDEMVWEAMQWAYADSARVCREEASRLRGDGYERDMGRIECANELFMAIEQLAKE